MFPTKTVPELLDFLFPLHLALMLRLKVAEIGWKHTLEDSELFIVQVSAFISLKNILDEILLISL